MRNQLFITSLFKNFLSLVLLAAVLSGAFSVAAQSKGAARTTKTSAAKPMTKQTGGNQNPGCSDGWSGIVTYTKTLNYTHDSGKTKRIPHGTNHSKISQDYKYTDRIVVDGSKGANVLRASRQVSVNDTRKNWTSAGESRRPANRRARATAWLQSVRRDLKLWTGVIQTVSRTRI